MAPPHPRMPFVLYPPPPGTVTFVHPGAQYIIIRFPATIYLEVTLRHLTELIEIMIAKCDLQVLWPTVTMSLTSTFISRETPTSLSSGFSRFRLAVASALPDTYLQNARLCLKLTRRTLTGFINQLLVLQGRRGPSNSKCKFERILELLEICDKQRFELQ